MPRPEDVTLAICTRERPEMLASALASFTAVTPPGVQILVVDSASTTPATWEVADAAGVDYVRSDIKGLSIARNLFLAHCRKERTARTHLTPDALRLAEEVWADEFLGDGDGFDYTAALRRCLDRLPTDRRRLVERRYGEGLSREQMAEAFRMTPDGVKAALRRVRQQLADCITTSLEIERQ